MRGAWGGAGSAGAAGGTDRKPRVTEGKVVRTGVPLWLFLAVNRYTLNHCRDVLRLVAQVILKDIAIS